MNESSQLLTGLDFSNGIALKDIPEAGMLLGRVGNDPALLVRQNGTLFAIGAICPHYGAPLVDGLLVDETIRCPWHHACFKLRTGEVLQPPAMQNLKTWKVEQCHGRAFVRKALPAPSRPKLSAVGLPASVIIVGGGAAGHAAAETLRREGYEGPVTLLTADSSPPYDRPNLSKDYLTGTAEPDWISLRPPEFYAENNIDLKIGAPVTRIDVEDRTVFLLDGRKFSYGALLLATGAQPVRLAVPGAGLSHVHVLRTLDDTKRLIACAARARNCVVVGAGFIGLEVAASLRTRGLSVHVVSPSTRPMERILGAALSDMIRTIHESRGVIFHLGTTVATITDDSVTLTSGKRLPADLVVTGIGVQPEVALAKDAGIAIDQGITVNELMQTSAPHVYASGDIARWPDRRSGQRIRVEHWVVAQRQGQTAARNILGQRRPFDGVPFFWSQHYDVTISYVGHAEQWDRLDIEGSAAAHDCIASFWLRGKKLAVATVGRDRDSLRAELAFEQERTP